MFDFLTDDQLFWILMVLSPFLVVFCLLAKQIDRIGQMLGLPPGTEFVGFDNLRMVGIVVGAIIAIITPLLRWLLLRKRSQQLLLKSSTSQPLRPTQPQSVPLSRHRAG